MGENNSNGEPIDLRPYLCIPYWTTSLSPTEPPDNGVRRPLPSSVISWDCQGIHASSYFPGQQLQVSVDVRNTGAGNQTILASVNVYWADATVGFSRPIYFASSLVAVSSRNGRATTPMMTGIIPSTASNHICLLAVVSHPLDPAGSVIDPINDRHWAQHNLQVITTRNRKSLNLPFSVANPYEKDKKFSLEIRQADERLTGLLGLRKKMTPRNLKGTLSFQVANNKGDYIVDGERPSGITINLRAWGHQMFHLIININDQLDEYEFATVEVLLKDKNFLVGSLGVIIKS